MTATCPKCGTVIAPPPVDVKAEALRIDTAAALACPWQDCPHKRCTEIREEAVAARARLGLVRDPLLITLHEANVAVQRVIEQARRKEDVTDAAATIIARIQHAIDHGAFDSVALAQEIGFARQAVEGRV